MPLARAQEAFAEEGQMLSLDPPGADATVGGVVAANDSGPLRARYGGVRDLVVGMRVALADGTIAKSGGKVIKNVAGYDLAKLFAGSFGTLGAILEVSVRLHPLSARDRHGARPLVRPRRPQPRRRVRSRTRASSSSASTSAGPTATALVLSRFGGAAPLPQAEAAERVLREAGLETELREDDDGLWEAQREGQRSPVGLAVRVSALQTDLERPAPGGGSPRRHARGPGGARPALGAPRRRPGCRPRRASCAGRS